MGLCYVHYCKILSIAFLKRYAWRENMDIHISSDNYGVVTYISEYLTKNEEGLMKKLREALNNTKG